MTKKNSFKVGEHISTKRGVLKIMAFADGYYMARYKGCVPFCCSEKDLQNRIDGIN